MFTGVVVGDHTEMGCYCPLVGCQYRRHSLTPAKSAQTFTLLHSILWYVMPNDGRRSRKRGGAKNPGTSATAADSTLSLNAMLELLTHHHRRELLRFLTDAPDHATDIDDVVTHLIEKDSEWTGARPAHNEIEAQLYHVHLPKLTEAGVIEYDARSKELRYRDHDRLEALLDSLQSFKKE